MPRKSRIEIPGFYHIVNRGIERRKVFLDTEDYERFEELMCRYAKRTVSLSTTTAWWATSTTCSSSRSTGQPSQGLCTSSIWTMRSTSTKSTAVSRPSLAGMVRIVGQSLPLRYIEQNPCQADIVEKPEEYSYSIAPIGIWSIKLNYPVLIGILLLESKNIIETDKKWPFYLLQYKKIKKGRKMAVSLNIWRYFGFL